MEKHHNHNQSSLGEGANNIMYFLHFLWRQTGAELGQAQVKLEV